LVENDYNRLWELAKSDESKGELYHCENGHCEKKIIYGFFENADIKIKSNYPYISCKLTTTYECKIMSEPTSNTCNNAGELIKVNNGLSDIIKVCLSTKNDDAVPLKSENVEFKFTTTKVFEIKYDNKMVIILDTDSVHSIGGSKNFFFIILNFFIFFY